jgi:hypothetical protein
MAVLLPVAMNGLSLSTRVSGLARDTAKATTLAEAKLGELLGSGGYLTGTGSGDFGDDAPGFVWTSELVNTTEAGIQELRVVVLWEEQGPGNQRDVSVSTLLYDPASVASATSQPAGGTQ